MESTRDEDDATITVQTSLVSSCTLWAPVIKVGSLLLSKIASDQFLYVLATSDKGRVTRTVQVGQFLHVESTRIEGDAIRTVQARPWSVSVRAGQQ